jgi:hypothetical protein
VSSSNAALKVPWLQEHQWKPGQSGNPAGKPKGRQHLENQFLADLAADWESNGKEAIKLARIDDPTSYVKVVASLMPKKVDPDGALDGITRDELRLAIAALQSFLAPRDPDSPGSTPLESAEAR